MSAERAWIAIEELAQYEDEEWNDLVNPEDENLNYENPNIEQLLGIIEHKLNALMKNALSAMGKSQGMFEMTRKEMYRKLSEPSRQEEFEHIVTNFIFNQEERIRQLKDYMQVISEEFMEFSSEVARRLKERIKENKNKPRKIKKIIRYPDTKTLENSAKQNFLENLKKKTFPTPVNLLCEMSKRARNTRGKASSSREETMEEKVRKFGLFDYTDHQMNYDNLARRSFHPGGVVDWEFLSNKGLAQYEPLHKGVTSRLGGVEREMSLLELGWRVGLYSDRESRDVATLSGLRRAETVNSTHLTHLFWPNIGDDRFNVGNIKAKSIKDLRIKLAHRCITMTITGRKETTNHVTEIDLFYLYCMFGEGVFCNIPYWLAKYLKGVRDKSVIFKGMRKSLVKMGVIMDLYEGECCWPVTRGIVKEDEGDDEEGYGDGGMRELGAPRISNGT
ncbi:hypothetical protein Tco_1035596 [Tanacetum coccineum]